MYAGHDVIRISGAEGQVRERFEKLNGDVRTANYKSQFLSGLMQPLMTFIGNFGYVAVCIIGALLVMKGQITFGVITAIIMYVRLFTSPLSTLAQGMTQMQTAAAAGVRSAGVTWGFRTRAELEQSGARHIVDRPAELLGLL